MLDAVSDVMSRLVDEGDCLLDTWAYLCNGRGLVYRYDMPLDENEALLHCAIEILSLTGDLGAYPFVESDVDYAINRCSEIINTIALTRAIVRGESI